VITPTIGRVVWYWPASAEPLQIIEPTQPFKADIVCVHADGTINLAGYDHGGAPFAESHCPLWEGEGARPEGSCWQWMPYQKGQAAKAEVLEKQLRA
jgi:hypothetical protein